MGQEMILTTQIRQQQKNRQEKDLGKLATRVKLPNQTNSILQEKLLPRLAEQRQQRLEGFPRQQQEEEAPQERHQVKQQLGREAVNRPS